MEVMGTFGLMGFLSLQRGTERKSDRASEREIGEERRWSSFVWGLFLFFKDRMMLTLFAELY